MRPLFSFLSTLLAVALLLALSVNTRAAVSLGIDELEKSNFAVLKGKRVGLITNPSGANSKGRSAISVLYGGSGFHLVKLFGPEHGIYGVVGAGLHVNNSRDKLTGLPVFSLYGDTRRPTPAMLAGLDTLVYDVQDLGSRSYTFISTLGYIMEEASKYNLEVVVLDRPNPLGGIRLEGPGLDPTCKSFVGLYNIPYVYGLTPGELAQWINAKYLPKPCKLTVVPMKGWTRNMVWEDTGLKWVPTSPNIPTIGSARGYTATGFLGEIGIENGIGTPFPFQIVAGRKWNSSAMAKRFNALHIPGVKASNYTYRDGSGCTGVYLNMDPRNAGNLTAISLQALEIIRSVVPGYSPFARASGNSKEMFDKVSGQAKLRAQLVNGRPVNDIIRSWDAGVARWAEERIPYLLYGNSKSAPVPSVTSTLASTPIEPDQVQETTTAPRNGTAF